MQSGRLWKPEITDAELHSFLIRNGDVVADLRTFFDFAEGFTLGLAEINFGRDAEALLTALQADPACAELQVVGLKFTDPKLRFLRDELVSCLAELMLDPNRKLVLLVSGLEQSIAMYGDAPPVLKDLNFVRDAYRDSLPHPLVLILPRGALSRLARFAPDFWAWQSGLFLFKTPPQQLEAAHSRLFVFNNLDRHKRRPSDLPERLDLLQRLLMEYQEDLRVDQSPEAVARYLQVSQQLGEAWWENDQPDLAAKCLNDALAKATLNDEEIRLDILLSLGRVYHALGDLDRAFASLEEARTLAQKLNDRPRLATSWLVLGYIESRRGNWEEAERLYRQSLELRTELGDRYRIAEGMGGFGDLELDRANLDLAEDYFNKALQSFQDLNAPREIAYIEFRLAQLWQRRQQPERARQHYTTARDLYRQLGAAQDLERIEQEWEGDV